MLRPGMTASAGQRASLTMNIHIMYTHIVMPNKTIYVKDTDLALLEQAQEQLGESVSSMFAEFLRDRVARLSPEENRIIDLINQITDAREAVKRQRDLPEFIESEHAEAQSYAERALKSFRAGEIRKTKALFWAANAYHDRAQQDAREVKELNGRIAEMLGGDHKPAGRRR
jgi:hypothetical protein